MIIGGVVTHISCCTPFREPLQFIVIAVMSVMGGTFPDTNRVFYMTVNYWCIRDRHVIVTVTVTEETPYLSGLPAGVTVMTLMTLIYGLILDRDAPLLRRPLPLQPDPTNLTHRASSPVPTRSLRQLAASGLSNLSDNPTLLPDERDGPSSGLSRAPSGQQLEPDDNKHLTDAGYSGHRRVRRVL
jgi:hypothetical protein